MPSLSLPYLKNGRTLAKLLELSYPVGNSDLRNLNTAHAVLLAAIKYKMTKAIHLAKNQDGPSSRLFYCRHGWKEEAQKAARCAANQPIENVYVPEMESMSAVVYHRPLKYHHNYRSAIAAIPCDYEKKSTEKWMRTFPIGGMGVT
jgi:hypothetical protein